jgi:hypothetical protein
MPPLLESPIIEAYASGPCDSICSLPFNFRCHPEMLISCQGDGERDRLIRPQAGVVETTQDRAPCQGPLTFSTAPRFCSPMHIRSVCTPDQR